MATVNEIIEIANKAKKLGCGDMNFNEFLRELDEYENDMIEELEERQSYFDAWEEQRACMGHGPY